MPIYEYECRKCKNIFEAILSSSNEAGKVSCTKCGSSDITKIMSAGSHRLKSGTSLPTKSSGGGCGGSSRFS